MLVSCHHCHNLAVLRRFTSSFPRLHLTQQLLPGQRQLSALSPQPQHWSACTTELAFLLRASSGGTISQCNCDIRQCMSACTAADPEGVCYKALGFSPGFAPDAPVSAYLKLLPMLAGIGSPGTIQEVPLHAFSVAACSQHACPVPLLPAAWSAATLLTTDIFSCQGKPADAAVLICEMQCVCQPCSQHVRGHCAVGATWIHWRQI